MVVEQNLYDYLLKKKDKTITETLTFYGISIFAFMYLIIVGVCIIFYFITVLPIMTILTLFKDLINKIRNNNDTINNN